MLLALFFSLLARSNAGNNRSHCISNQRQVTFTLFHYETLAGRFPGYATVRRYGPDGKSKQAMPYVWAILDELGRPDLKRAFGQGGQHQSLLLDDAAQVGSLDLLICPSDTTATRDNNGQMSYVVNAGLLDGTRDTPATAVFFYDGNAPAPGQLRYAMSIKEIDQGDGSTQTLLVSENFAAGTWYGDPSEHNVAFCWSDSRPEDFRVNAPVKGPRPLPAARSHHPGGVVASFADGHVQFIHETVDPKVWSKLFTPRGDAAPQGMAAWVHEPLSSDERSPRFERP
jgi:prepilin-type processing-associated H-X9-DG protein